MQIEADLVVELGNRRFDEVRVSLTESVEESEGFWVEFRDTVENLRFDMIHIGGVVDVCVVILADLGGEPLEGCYRFFGVIRLTLVLFDEHAPTLDVHAIANPLQGVLNGRGFARQIPERAALDKFGQMPGKMLQSAGSWLDRSELRAEHNQSITIRLDGVDKPALSLQVMPQLVCLIVSAPHRSHAVDESQDCLPGLVAFEILENLVAVQDGTNVA
ncbi:hypothetical protein [Mycobacterium bourgelatii]|uniref:hypothetical protein n=1 Tax=Mycobacterium bourgelatii TaxID=1273442 RepID=UPI001F08289F|nr:hypothetical protein [Mycobacterium bourgelatii]